jgi:hypothetical protein
LRCDAACDVDDLVVAEVFEVRVGEPDMGNDQSQQDAAIGKRRPEQVPD